MFIKFSVVKHSPRLVYRASFTDVDKGSASLIGSRGCHSVTVTYWALFVTSFDPYDQFLLNRLMNSP